MPDNENVCCPELQIADCADTDEHKHLMCGYSNTVITNKIVKDICVGNFDKCLMRCEVG